MRRSERNVKAGRKAHAIGGRSSIVPGDDCSAQTYAPILMHLVRVEVAVSQATRLFLVKLSHGADTSPMSYST